MGKSNKLSKSLEALDNAVEDVKQSLGKKCNAQIEARLDREKESIKAVATQAIKGE